MYIIPIIMLLVSAAVFWLAYVFVTQDHSQSWKKMILWVIVANLLSLPAALLLEMSKTTTYEVISEILTIAITYTVLYLVLTYKYSIHTVAKKIKILAIHLVAMQLFGLVGRWM
ncbi:hypothetical protein K9N50_00180 [bacterium]|nr:hypothetical protein [bacterium]